MTYGEWEEIVGALGGILCIVGFSWVIGVIILMII